MATDCNNRSVPRALLLPLPTHTHTHSTLTSPLPSVKREEGQPREVEVPAEKTETVSIGGEVHPGSSQPSLQGRYQHVLPVTVNFSTPTFQTRPPRSSEDSLGEVFRSPPPHHTTTGKAMHVPAQQRARLTGSGSPNWGQGPGRLTRRRGWGREERGRER